MIILKFPADKNNWKILRTIPDKKWLPSGQWEIPHQYKKVLERCGFLLEDTFVRKPAKSKIVSQILLQSFGKTLMPFQEEGVFFLEENNGRVLIGDEMGLGKTIQSLAYLQVHPELRPALVICPNSLKLNWQAEILAGMGKKTSVHIIESQDRDIPPADIYILNYDKIANQRQEKFIRGKKRRVAVKNTGWVDYLPELKAKAIILDEFQRLANYSADRTKDAIRFLRKYKGALIGLSGTPITSRPIQFYSMLSLLLPKDKLPPWKIFGITYCGGKHNGFGWDFKGSSNEKGLHLLVKEIMIRRLKKDVLKDLPDKIQQVIPLPLSAADRLKYLLAADNVSAWAKTVDPLKASAAQKANGLLKFQVLQDLARKGRWKSTIEWIKETLDAGEKLIVFGRHHVVIDDLMLRLKKYNPVKVDGRNSLEERDQAVMTFQADDTCRLFVGSDAAAEGLTLTAASGVVFVELFWNPGLIDQASDRAHRIGQKSTVNIYYIIAVKTIEEELAEMLDKKRKMIAAVVDGKKVVESGSLLSELIKKYRSL